MRAWLRSPDAANPNQPPEYGNVAGLLDAYLARVKDSKADKTYRSYESIIRHHIKPRVGALDPARIT